MKFKVGDIVYWKGHPDTHWKILELHGNDSYHGNNGAKLELIKRDKNNFNFAQAKIGTKLVWHLTAALLVERKHKKRSHPLTNIFKD